MMPIGAGGHGDPPLPVNWTTIGDYQFHEIITPKTQSVAYAPLGHGPCRQWREREG
jgi:hypothetical protein